MDAYLSTMLVSFLGASAKPSFAMFEAIHQTARNQALRAAAKVHLSQEDNEIFATLLSLVKPEDTHRNRIAHWLWAYSDDIPDGLLLIDPGANFEFVVRMTEKIETGNRAEADLDRSRVLVYKMADLQEIIARYKRISEWIVGFNRHIHPHLERDEWQYREMLASPAFRQALARNQPQARKPTILERLRKPRGSGKK